MAKGNLVYGIGLNDADYTVNPANNVKRECCPYYEKWKNMLERCYSKKYQLKNPSYIGCSVCSDWLVFSNFKKWMENQDWEGKSLDKDLLVNGNKIYSPETCVFVDERVNNFTTGCASNRGNWPIGVSFRKDFGKFQARCSNDFTKKNEHLGFFSCPSEAHLAWKRRKHELACELANLQSDSRVAKALSVRFL